VLLGVHLRPLVSGLLAVLTVSFFHRVFPPILAIAQVRYLIPIQLFVDFLIFASIYVLCLVAVRQVTATDRRNFMGLMSFGFEFVRHPFREWIKIYR
jgi:hypothetical protein